MAGNRGGEVGNVYGTGIGEWLRAARAARGLSLRETAGRAGVAAGTLSYWERGIHQPSLSELEAVLALLDVSASERAYLFAAIDATRATRRLRQTEADDMVLGITAPPLAGELLRALRLRRSWTLEQVANGIGVSQSTVTRWERGDAWPATQRLHTLCQLLDALPEEAAALTAGRLADGASIAEVVRGMRCPEERMAYLHDRLYFAIYVSMSRPDWHALRELTFLSLEAVLWPIARGEMTKQNSQAVSEAACLLVSAYARHAQLLVHLRRWREAREMAHRALTVLGQVGEQTANHRLLLDGHWPVTLIALAESARETSATSSDLQATWRHIAKWSRSELPRNPLFDAWIWTTRGSALAALGERTAAVTASDHGVQLAEAKCGPVEIHFRRCDHARLLLYNHRPEEAATILPEFYNDPTDVAQCAALEQLWAQVHTARGKTNAADERLRRVVVCCNAAVMLTKTSA